MEPWNDSDGSERYGDLVGARGLRRLLSRNLVSCCQLMVGLLTV